MTSRKPDHPKVFISYSHDSREHMDRVLDLSNRLRAEGIDCHIDQYEESPPEGWPRWMIDQIEEAAFVLVVCTDTYERRFRGKEKTGKGLGAKWEGAIITQELYEAQANNSKFIPVLFSSHNSARIPIFLRSATHYELYTEEGYEALYRRLTGQPRIQKPELGKLSPMPPLGRRQDFPASTNGLFDFLKLVGVCIAALIGFVTAVVNFIGVLKGNTRLVTAILLITGIGILWLSFLYMYFEPNIVKRPAYPEWSRRLALVGIIAVPILTAAGFAGWKYYQSLPSDKIIILIANFDGPDQDYGVTETIIEQLREATREYSDVRIQALNKAITVQEGSDVARAKGEERKASIVLWGWYRKPREIVKVTVHFQVLQRLRYLPLLQEKETLIATAAELESFEIQERLSGEMIYLTLLTIGLARYEAQDYDGAIDRFTNALIQPAVPEQMISPADVYFYRGLAYALKSDYDPAIVDFDQAIKLKPNLAEAYSNRGVAYYSKGNYDQAIADFDQAIKLKPDLAVAYNNRGNAYREKSDYDQAIADYNQAIALQPDLAVGYNNRGVAYKDKGDYDRGIADYNQAIKLKPDLAEAYGNRGNAYNDKGDYDRAIADHDQAIKLKPNLAEAYYNRGNAYKNKGDYDHAIADFTQAIALRPDLVLAYNNRGIAYGHQGDYNRAIADHDQAIKLKPNLAEAYYNRGNAYKNKGDYDHAIADFTQAIALKPDLPEAYYNRGNIYKDKGDYNHAVADFTQAIKLRPDDASAYNNRGVAYGNKGDYNQAIADFDQAIVLKPDLAEAYYNRGVIYKNKGDKHNAIEDFKKILELTNDPNIRQKAGQQLQKLGVE